MDVVAGEEAAHGVADEMDGVRGGDAFELGVEVCGQVFERLLA